MELEKQVCSLDLAKRLKELGVKQESLFAWYHEREHWVGGVIAPARGLRVERNVGESDLTYPNEYLASAFTVAELVSQLQEIEQEDIIVALSDKHVADTLATRLCTKLQDLKGSAGSGLTR